MNTRSGIAAHSSLSMLASGIVAILCTGISIMLYVTNHGHVESVLNDWFLQFAYLVLLAFPVLFLFLVIRQYRADISAAEEQRAQADHALATLEKSISDRTRDLEASLKRFTDIAKVSSDWIWESDENHIITYISERLTSVLGIPPEAVLGRSRIEFARGCGEAVAEHMAVLAAHRPFRNFCYWIDDQKGERKYVSINGVPVFDADGRFIGYRGTGSDRTREVSALSELARREQRLNAILNTVDDAVVTVETDGTIESFNHSAEQLFGYRSDEAVGMPFVRLLVRCADDGHDQTADTCLQSTVGDAPREIAAFHQDGRALDVEVRVGEWELGDDVLRIATMRDISNRKSAEKALRQSEERYRTITSNIPGVVFQRVRDKEGRFRSSFVSDGVREIYGIPSDVAMSDHIRAKDYTHPDDVERVREAFRKSTETLEPISIEFRIIVENGGLKWLRSSINVSQGEAGTTVWDGVALDITDLKNAETALSEREASLNKANELLTDAIESMSDAFAYFDQDERLVLHNAMLGEQIGVVRGESLLGVAFREIIEGVAYSNQYAEHGRAEEQIAWRMKMHETNTPHTQEMSDGKTFLVREYPVESGGFLLTRTDITDLKNAEIELVRKERHLSAILENLTDGVVTLDQNGDIETFNRAAERMFGRSAEQVAGQSATILFAEERADACRRAIDRALDGRRLEAAKSKQLRLPAVRANGDAFALEATLSRMEVAGARKLVAVVRDMTAMERAASEKTKMELELRQSQKVQALGTLAGGIAHDLNNTLVPVLSMSALVMEEMPVDSDERQCMQHVIDASTRARDLVAQILAFSRQDKPSRETMSVEAIFNETLPLVRATVPKSIEISLKVNGTPGDVAVDKTQMHQVLMNLASNASDAMGVLGGRLDIEVEEDILTPAMVRSHPELQAGRYVRLTIADNGPGVDAFTLERIFDPFFTTKDVGQGTGMGLSVVHGIVNQHGGTITARSTLGKGVTFEILLPCAPDAAVRDQRADEAVRGIVATMR